MSGRDVPEKGLTLDLEDIVVDTNIWMHASNPDVDTFIDALEFVLSLKRSPTLLCFDTGASINEAENRSKILSEYRAHIGDSGVGSHVLAHLLNSGRWTDIDPKVVSSQRKVILQNIPDSSDHIFAKVATNSKCRSLISHDYTAFHQKCKAALKAACKVRVLTCSEILADTADCTPG